MKVDLGAGLVFGGANESIGLIAGFLFRLQGSSVHAILVFQGGMLLMSLGIFLFTFCGLGLPDLWQAKRRIATAEVNKKEGS